MAGLSPAMTLSIDVSTRMVSDTEDLRVARLDLLAILENCRGVVFHRLDLAQRRAPGMLLGLRMHRPQTADIDAELLTFRREAEALEQARCIRAWCGLEQAIRPDDQRIAFGRIHRLDRLTGFSPLQDQVFDAISLDRTFPQRDFFRRVGGRLHLQNVLLRELFEILPAQVARHLESRGHDRSAVARVRLDDLALPFWVKQVSETFRRLFFLYHVGVVGDDAQE